MRSPLLPDVQMKRGPSGSGRGGYRRYLSREDIRHLLDAWEAADPQYFARLKRRYGKPQTK